MKRKKLNIREYLRQKEVKEVIDMSLEERLYLGMELSEFCLRLSKTLKRKRT